MASWFSGAALGDKLNGLKDLSAGLKAKVQEKVKIDPDFIKKLTLNSDEMISEREQILEEERRKEAVGDSLAEILPWETRDAEMEILVDECKDIILGLSSKEETFTSPFILSGGFPPADGADEKEDEEEEGEEDEERKAAKDMAAAQVSSDKLSKLQPLPKLLADFDLDTHVGLIQRLLQVDPKLVEMQSRLSSGGQRELVFWKNYFFHCAYTRYEAGLSIDEIWSNEPNRKTGPAVSTGLSSSSAAAVAAAEEAEEEFDAVDNDDAEEVPDEEVVFDSSSSVAASVESGSKHASESFSEVDASDAAEATAATAAVVGGVESISPPSSPQRGSISAEEAAMESSGGDDGVIVADGWGDDASTDSLDAEIAAALDD